MANIIIYLNDMLLFGPIARMSTWVTISYHSTNSDSQSAIVMNLALGVRTFSPLIGIYLLDYWIYYEFLDLIITYCVLLVFVNCDL